MWDLTTRIGAETLKELKKGDNGFKRWDARVRWAANNEERMEDVQKEKERGEREGEEERGEERDGDQLTQVNIAQVRTDS